MSRPLLAGVFAVLTGFATAHLGEGAPQRRTVCGLTIWNVSPDLDPRMVLRATGPSVDPKIEKLAPSACRP